MRAVRLRSRREDVDECVAIEPALAQCRGSLAGGIYTATTSRATRTSSRSELGELAAGARLCASALASTSIS
jgi:hypothetical protein